MNQLYQSLSPSSNNQANQLLEFAKTLNPQQAQERVNQLLSSGQMTQDQFNMLVNQAKQIAALFK